MHVLKSLNKTLKFYKKFSFIKSKQNESKNVLKWITKCTKYDKNTFKDKHLIIKDFKLIKSINYLQIFLIINCKFWITGGAKMMLTKIICIG